jgi:hypothetical protein
MNLRQSLVLLQAMAAGDKEVALSHKNSQVELLARKRIVQLFLFAENMIAVLCRKLGLSHLFLEDMLAILLLKTKVFDIHFRTVQLRENVRIKQGRYCVHNACSLTKESRVKEQKGVLSKLLPIAADTLSLVFIES